MNTPILHKNRRMARPAPAATVTASAASKPAQKAGATTLTKAAKVLALLQRKQGATLAELVSVTDWQPHSLLAHAFGKS